MIIRIILWTAVILGIAWIVGLLYLAFNPDLRAQLSQPIVASQETTIHHISCVFNGELKKYDFKSHEGYMELGQSGTRITINHQRVATFSPGVPCSHTIEVIHGQG